jgi:hypothetical protein
MSSGADGLTEATSNVRLPAAVDATAFCGLEATCPNAAPHTPINPTINLSPNRLRIYQPLVVILTLSLPKGQNLPYFVSSCRTGFAEIIVVIALV